LKAKKQNVLSFKQESKALRMNSCIELQIRNYGITHGVKGMNWNGRDGDMYDLIDIDGVKVATNYVKLMFPKDYQEIGFLGRLMTKAHYLLRRLLFE
jgi:hypothetical protein